MKAGFDSVRPRQLCHHALVLQNTSTPYAEAVLEQLLVGQQAHVPVLWLYD
jgi:hypothetical protein